MSDSCDMCGYKSSEVKGGGAISERGRSVTLHVSEQDDLRRDVIKADTATVRSPLPMCHSFECPVNTTEHS